MRTFILLVVAAVIMIFFGFGVRAETNPFTEAFDLCQEREARSPAAGIEISPFPIEWRDGLWMVMWADGSETALLTLKPIDWVREGLMPFAVRDGNDIVLIIPVPEVGAADSVCYSHLAF